MILLPASGPALISAVSNYGSATYLDSISTEKTHTNPSYETVYTITVPSGLSGVQIFRLSFEIKCNSEGRTHRFRVKVGGVNYMPCNYVNTYGTINGTTYKDVNVVLAVNSGTVIVVEVASQDGIDGVVTRNCYLRAADIRYTTQGVTTSDWTGALVAA